MEADLIEQELNTLVDYFEDYDNVTIEERDIIETERDYYDNKQFTDEEIATLSARKQPIITFNLIKRTVDAILGLEQQTRTDPKAYPRTPQHEEDADAITDALRYVADNVDLDHEASDCFFHLLVEGTGGMDVYVEPKGDKIEVGVKAFDWDRFFYDPHSRKKDFSDAKYYGISIWKDLDDAKAEWPEAVEALERSFNSDASFNDTFDDTPRTTWVSKDRERKRVRVNQIYYRKKDGWYLAYYVHGGFVVEPKLSPYLDEDGEPEPSIVAGSAFIDRDGYRYGYIRQLISPQDEVNKRRSKALHLLNQRQTFGNKKAGIDAATANHEMAKPDGHLQMNGGEFGKDFGIIPTNDLAQGNFQLLQEAKDMFSTIGTNTAVTGISDGGVRSGRAEQFRQLAGTRELTPILDIHKGIKKRVYRKIWNRIKQYWTEERWVRVTDNEQNMKWVGLNTPITVGDQLKEEYGEIPRGYENDPRMNVKIGTKNQLSELDVDIILEEVPDIVNIQSEQFDLLTQLYTANPESIPFDAIIESSQLRNKRAILESIKGDPQAQQAAAQKAQEQEQIQKQMIQGELEKTQSEVEKNIAQSMKLQAETVEIAQGPQESQR